MGANSSIEWTDHTFNPWIGCTKVSAACKNCYAESYDERWNEGAHWGANAPRRRTSEANWKKPLAWNKRCEVLGIRQRVFCASLADVCEDHPSLQPWREDLHKLIEDTPHLDWLLLTKRPENFSKFFPALLPDNVWVGTTVENQAEADKRIPELLKIPAVIRFLSCEPLLGAVDLTRWLGPHNPATCGCENHADYCPYNPDALDLDDGIDKIQGRIDWVITGGESGPNARPMHLDWARLLRDQCKEVNVPFFFKQWGEWADPSQFHKSPDKPYEFMMIHEDGRTEKTFTATESVPDGEGFGFVLRPGKKKAGNLLDGQKYLGVPRYNHTFSFTITNPDPDNTPPLVFGSPQPKE